MIMMLITIAIVIASQAYLRITYGKWSQRPNAAGITGREAAELIIRKNNLNSTIRATPGALTDHYDPRSDEVRLSDRTYHGTDIAAIAIAAHEVGHAIQHHARYAPLKLRMSMLPAAGFGERFGPFVIILGAILGSMGLLTWGIILFSIAVAFHLVTLPTEFDASARARRQLTDLGVVTAEDTQGIRSTLNAAALTYVAGAATSVLYLLYYVSAFFGNRE